LAKTLYGDQLALPITRDEESLRSHFEKITGRSVSLTVTDNSTSMLSMRKKGERLFIRLQRIFLDAEDEVIAEIGAFLKKEGGKTPLLNGFVQQNRAQLRPASPRKTLVRTQGRYYDLEEIFDSVNKEYFHSRLSCPITWGTRNPRHVVRKRTLGSYNNHTRTIRIHPILDRKQVPRYFIEFVVYHEMLHADMGTVTALGRRSVHSREFRRREKMFRHNEKAVAWERGRDINRHDQEHDLIKKD
jgi:hypothetical protein